MTHIEVASCSILKCKAKNSICDILYTVEQRLFALPVNRQGRLNFKIHCTYLMYSLLKLQKLVILTAVTSKTY